MQKKSFPKKGPAKPNELWLFGKHAVIAALNAKQRKVYEIWALKKYAHELAPFAAVAPLKIMEPKAFDKFGDDVHQGIAARVGPLPQLDLSALKDAKLLMALDQVTDPHNLGAILRSCAAFGAEGIIVPEHGSAPLTAVALKAAVGAAEIVPVVQVTNLAKALDELKQHEFWSIGLAGEGADEIQNIDTADRKMVVVMGSEGKGLRPSVAKQCDYLAKIPMSSKVESLNVSVAAGITLFSLTKKI